MVGEGLRERKAGSFVMKLSEIKAALDAQKIPDEGRFALISPMLVDDAEQEFGGHWEPAGGDWSDFDELVGGKNVGVRIFAWRNES